MDSECASTVCNVDTGACLAPADIVYVSPSGAAVGDCTQNAPCSIARAQDVITPARSVIRMTGAFTSVVELIVPKSYTIVGTGATVAGIGLQMKMGGGMATVRGLVLEGTVSCRTTTGARNALTLRDVSAGGLNLSKCLVQANHIDAIGGGAQIFDDTTVVIDRSHITHDFIASGANIDLVLTNSVLRDGLSFSAGANFRASGQFNTFLSGLGCYIGASNVFENNIVYQAQAGNDNALVGTCTFRNNIAFPQLNTVGTNTIIADPKFVDFANNDYHLMSDSPAIDAADPNATTLIDHDGTARPQGAADLGAFEYAP